jgi:hypothetical protein
LRSFRVASLLLASACGSPAFVGPDGGTDAARPDVDAASDASAPEPAVAITTTVNSTRFVTREHMLAAGEMQISGEPYAEAMGRDLGGYSRDQIPTDLYYDPDPALDGAVWIDVPGFSTGVESYEYSKQPMNNLAFESGAGTSLAYAPLVDFDGAVGSAATTHMADLVQQFAGESDATGDFVFAAGMFPAGNPFGDRNPKGIGSAAENPLGWPGIWPTAHVFASFDPTIAPTSNVDLICSITSDDTPSESGAELDNADYECDATTLHLVDRATQIDPTLTPGADGFSGWKYGLWTLNYLQVMHDSTEAAVSTVDTADLANVGTPGNTIIGQDGSGAPTAPGTFIGSSKIEGFQAAMFIEMMDNRAEDWLMHLSTADGATLGGFASLSDALGYAYDTPLRWFPGKVAVSETDDGGGFPRPSYSLASADSDALDLIGLALAYGEFFALTDMSNPDVGGAQAARVYFDGDPFAADDQLADGEATLHDRALAMMRVAIVNLDRLHTDPATGVLVDDVAMTGATPSRGHTISTTTVAYAMLGLRTVARSLSSQLELYSNNTPDAAVVSTPLDALPIDYPTSASLTFSGRVEQMLRTHADLLYDHLTDATGRAYPGWDVAAGAVTDTSDTLDAHTAAIRGLFAAFLATGDVRYRDRAMAVFNRMQTVFYDPVARIYSATPAPVDDVEFTPLRFALLQSALRDVYEIVVSRAGGENLELPMEAIIGRLNKLVLDGWDDRNMNNRVDWPDECTSVVGPIPQGGLQMGERTLTGEIGSLDDRVNSERIPTIDRNQNCIPEIDDAHLPAALADSVTFHIARQ